jgi:hypothetical protein
MVSTVDDWCIVDVRVSDVDMALGFVDAALDSGVDYGIDVLECALRYRSDDLDCCRGTASSARSSCCCFCGGAMCTGCWWTGGGRCCFGL